MCGEGEGLILENPYHLGESLNGVAGLDIDEEEKVVRDKLGELQQQGATEDEVKVVMKDLGTSRLVCETLNVSLITFTFFLSCHHFSPRNFTYINIFSLQPEQSKLRSRAFCVM